MAKFRKHDFETEITGICHSGGLSTYDEREVETRGAIPGDIVQVWPYKVKRTRLHAKIDSFIKKSPLRSQSDCEHYPECGGCSFRDIEYKNQLQLKQQIITNELTKHKIECAKLKEIIPAPNTHYYRNKMEYTFGTSDEKKIVLGMHKKGVYDQIVSTNNCLLISKKANDIMTAVENWANESNLTAYNPNTHEGLLRHLIIRETKYTDQIMVMLSASANFDELHQIIKILQDKNIDSFLFIKNANKSDAVDYTNIKTVFGNDFITEELNNKLFQISPSSFFQTNPTGTLKLYEYVKEHALKLSNGKIMDLFCGTGSIGIFCADDNNEITGVDISESSIKDAKRNAIINSLSNVNYLCMDARQYIKNNPDKIKEHELIIIDPPRNGLHPKARQIIFEMERPYIIYISCNPRTLAQDLFLFMEKYSIESIQPFDQFPYTPHLENVVILKKI